LTTQANEEIHSYSKTFTPGKGPSFQLVYPDISKIQTNVKRMNFISFAEGLIFSLQSNLKLEKSFSSTGPKKLFQLGSFFFNASLTCSHGQI
jgi:hypothetical protein